MICSGEKDERSNGHVPCDKRKSFGGSGRHAGMERLGGGAVRDFGY
jgi:hypothetical protein